MKKAQKKMRFCLLLILLAGTYGCKNNERTESMPGAASYVPAEATTPSSEISDASEAIPSGSEVYICKSSGAKRYHLSKACKGLGRCSHTIEKTTKKEAEAMGLTLCKWED